MSHHYTSIRELPQGGEHLDARKLSVPMTGLLAVGVLGLVASIYFFFGASSEGQAEYAYSGLFGFFFFFTIGLGGMFWLLLHHATNSGWGVAVRRVFENIANMMPWLFVLALPLLLPRVQDSLWEWMGTHREVAEAAEGGTEIGLKYALEAEGHYLMYKKYGFLNLEFWHVRFVLYFALLSFGAWFLRKKSLQQEQDGAFSHTFTARRFACGWLPVFAVSATFAGVDWLMALDYTWFSTMWGVFIFASSALSSMAVTILLVTMLRGQGYLKKVVSSEHYHLMGKFLFAFVVFWAYISFSQFFLIWYANITEETRFFILRNTEGWNAVSIFLLFGHFAIPFVALLPVWVKKNPKLICSICVWILFVHMVDMYWVVIPERGPSLYHELWVDGAWWRDAVAFLTIGCLFTYLLLRSFRKSSLYPWRDPRLEESVNLSN